MKPYEGKEPYLFVSYSHKDREIVKKCINNFQKKLCYVWYDEGNHVGDDWAENIAEHLVNANCVMLFISSESIRSVNVNNELTMALNYNKRIIPVYLEDVKIPLGWEIKIGIFHAMSVPQDEEKMMELLLNELPEDVFKKTCSPFYSNDRHEFYFVSEESASGFSNTIAIVCGTGDNKEIIWKYVSPGPYEIVPCTNDRETDDNGEHPVLVNIQKQVDDEFFNMKGNGCVIFSVRIALLLPYPLCGPDGDGIIVFALVDPLGDKPRIKVLDSMTSYDGYKDTEAYVYDPFVAPDEDLRVMKILPRD